MGFSLDAESGGSSLVVEHGLSGARASVPGSVDVVPGLSCFAACGMFMDQGLNLCLPCSGQILYH